MQTCIGSFLQKRALLQPERVGLVFKGRKISYQQWSEQANRAAHAFIGLGVSPGDRVGLLLENSPEFLECFFALAHIGAIVVPLNWRLASPELSGIVRNSGISALVYHFDFQASVTALEMLVPDNKYVTVGGESLPGGYNYEDLLQTQVVTAPQTGGAAQDPAVIYYTSGTTGLPKGAVLSHDNLFFGALTIGMSLDWRTNDQSLVAMPLFHIGGLITTLIAIYFGATTVLMKSFDPVRFLGNIETFQINSFVAVESMLQQMATTEIYPTVNLSSVRWVLSGPVLLPLLETWAGRGITIQQVYGLTETVGGAAVLAAEHAFDRFGSTGLPMFHNDIRIVGEDGSDCEPEQVGEILIQGPNVMLAYWNNPAATAEANKNGWLATGDLGKLDEAGFLYVVGRKKDMIRSGGENIYPASVEAVIAEMPQIKEIAVVGNPDKVWGEEVCAVARLHAGSKLSLSEVVAHCRGRLGSYKVPKRLVLTDILFPRSPTGRVQKQDLKRLLFSDDEIQNT